MNLYKKTRSYLISNTKRILGLNLLKQEAMLRLALKEEGFSLKKLPLVPGFAPVLSSIRPLISAMGIISLGLGNPMAIARLAFGSASMASTE